MRHVYSPAFMRTTLNIDDSLYRLAKSTAALRGCSVTSIIEEPFRMAFQASTTTAKFVIIWTKQMMDILCLDFNVLVHAIRPDTSHH